MFLLKISIDGGVVKDVNRREWGGGGGGGGVVKMPDDVIPRINSVRETTIHAPV